MSRDNGHSVVMEVRQSADGGGVVVRVYESGARVSGGFRSTHVRSYPQGSVSARMPTLEVLERAVNALRKRQVEGLYGQMNLW